jgi:hypothetical protein
MHANSENQKKLGANLQKYFDPSCNNGFEMEL